MPFAHLHVGLKAISQADWDNVHATMKLGQKALSEAIRFAPPFVFPEEVNQLREFVQDNRARVLNVYRWLEPTRVLLEFYVRDASRFICSLKNRSHADYPRSFIQLIDTNSCLIQQQINKVLTPVIPHPSETLVSITTEASVSHPPKTLVSHSPETSVSNPPETTVPNTTETMVSNPSEPSVSLTTRSIADLVGGSHPENNDFTYTHKEVHPNDIIKAVNEANVKDRILEGTPADVIAREIAEKVFGEHPLEVMAMITEYEVISNELQFTGLHRQLNETLEKIKMRIIELDKIQSQYDPGYVLFAAKSTLAKRLKISYSEIDKRFFEQHIMPLKELYEDTVKRKRIAKLGIDTQTTLSETLTIEPMRKQKARHDTTLDEESSDSSDSETRNIPIHTPLRQIPTRSRIQNTRSNIPVVKLDLESPRQQTIEDNIMHHSTPVLSHTNRVPDLSLSTMEIARNYADHSAVVTDHTIIPTDNVHKRMDHIEGQINNIAQMLKQLTCQATQSRMDVESERKSSPEPISAVPPVLPQSYFPTIDIPSFSGNVEDFPRFWETFCSIIDNQKWPDVAKFSFLLTKLDGNAAAALKKLPLTKEGYQLAKKELKFLFLDEHLLEITLEKKFDSIPKAQENSISLLQTICTIENIIEMRKRYQEHLDHPALIRRVANLFPNRISVKALQDPVARKRIEDFLRNIKKQVNDKRITELTIDNNKESTVFHIHTPRSLDRCKFCKGSHKSERCRKYTTIPDRLRIIKRHELCFGCLSTKHTSRYCREPPCKVCNKPHHAAICKSYSNNRTDRNDHENRSRDHSRSSYRKRDHSRSINRKPSYDRHRSGSRTSAHSRYRSYSRDSSRSYNRHNSNDSHYKQRSLSRDTSLRNPSHTDKRARRDPTPYHRDHSQSPSNDNRRALWTSNSSQPTSHMIVETKIMIDGEYRTIYGLIDTGADGTFITDRLSQQLTNVTKETKRLTVATFGNDATTRQVDLIANLPFYNSHDEHIRMNVLSYPVIIRPIHPVQLTKKDESFLRTRHMAPPSFLTLPEIEIDLLIGLDNFHLIHKECQSMALPSGLMITDTFFGPVIFGKPGQSSRTLLSTTQTIRTKILITQITSVSDSILHGTTLTTSLDEFIDTTEPNVEHMWNLESIKIFDNITKNEEENKVLHDFMQSVHKKDDGIYVSFPWKENKHELSSNYFIAFARLKQLSFKLQNDHPELWKQYNQLFVEQLNSRIVEEIPNWRAHPLHDNPVYYLPHRAVIKQSSRTTKVRIVMDGSSKARGALCLNDVIHQGPSILPNICGILIRSRCGNHLLTADIEKAFHQIHLNDTDKDCTRFLVPIDYTAPVTEDNVKALRHTRPAFGINASPFLLAGGIYYGLDLFQDTEKRAISTVIKDNLYVDNLVLTFDDACEGARLYRITKDIFHDLNMNLREYTSDLEHTRRLIATADSTQDVEVKLLGIKWNTLHDTYSINMTLGEVPAVLTKRNILRAAHSTYDPLGFMTPLFITPRAFIQKLWAYDYAWDSPLSEDHVQEWTDIYECIHGHSILFPRRIQSHDFLINQPENSALNVFVDASKIAFAAVAYVTTSVHNKRTTEFLMAKHRLAPRSKTSKKVLTDVMTIPKLELTALVLGVKLIQFILEQSHIHFGAINIFGDSTIALSWLISNKSHGVFVDNRIRDIRALLQLIEDTYKLKVKFYHVATEYNAADLATRGLTKTEFEKSCWLSGPPFLVENTNAQLSTIDILQEFKPQAHTHEERTICTATNRPTRANILNYEKYNIVKNIRIMAYVLRFIKHCRKGKRTFCLEFFDSIPRYKVRQFHIIFVEMQLARHCILRDVQKEVDIDNPKLRNLQLFYDGDGIIHAGGRLMNLTETDTAFPIFLPDFHPMTLKYIEYLHKSVNHFGMNYIRSEFRRMYWTPKLHRQINMCLRKCMFCKKNNNRPYSYPALAPLPKSRLVRNLPFEHVGIDLAGPFRVHDAAENMNRWIVLFSCFTTRAIHLEVVPTLSAQDFALCYRKFIARRGKPRTILSDNGTNFTATSATFQAIFEASPFLSEHTKWSFITPLSPWKGGLYERMVGLVKKALKAALRHSCHQRVFDTLVTEAEAIVNSHFLLPLMMSMIISLYDPLIYYYLGRTCPH